MDHEDKGETTEEDRVYTCNSRRVRFKRDENNVKYINGHDGKPDSYCLVNDEHTNGQKHSPPDHTHSCSEKLSDSEKTESSDKLVGILRPRTISLSPPPLPTVSPTAPFLSFSKLSKAMKRSSETMGCIEKLGKRIFHRPEFNQPELEQNAEESSCSHLKNGIENGEMEHSSRMRQDRRTVSLENTKAILGQSLPPTMMPFVEEALKAAHFLRRRRKENGHGRIIHKILIEQHKRVMKELARYEHRNGDTNGSSRQQSDKSE